jgi:PKD repeat protein
MTDPGGEALVPQRDIRSLAIAELYDSKTTANKLFFTLRVDNLDPITPQSRWTIYFTRNNPNNVPTPTTEWFVAMQTDDRNDPTTNLTPRFVYGHREPPVPPSTVATLVTDGTVDFGSYNPDGTITIAIGTPTKTSTAANARAFPPLQTGEALATVNAVTQQTGGALLVNDDSTGNGNYTLVGNQACAPNAAPLARLTATPMSGPAPLTVQFNASGSTDPDPSDTIVSYKFTFGDGSPDVTKTSPTVQHTYQAAGPYQARVRVKDSRGKLNENAATVMIDVEAPQPDLIVSNLVSSNNQAKQGDKVTFTATITNQGQATAAASKTEFKLDATTVLATKDTPSIAPGGSARVAVPWQTTAKTPKGNHTIRATADRAAAVDESDEANNTRDVTIYLQGNKAN